MTNKIVCFVPASQELEGYQSRSEVIEISREMLRELTKRFGFTCRVGIGSIQPLGRLSESYRDAANALRNTDGSVAHCRDLPIFCEYEENYPIEIEESIFDYVKKGMAEESGSEADRFFNWMERSYGECVNDIKLKILEFVLMAEHIAYESGGMVYHFTDRADYLETVMCMKHPEEMRRWFVENIIQAARNVINSTFPPV